MRKAAGEAVERGSRGPEGGTGRRTRRDRAKKRTQAAMELDVDRLRRQLGATKADRTVQRVSDAADAFGDERYEDARRLLRGLVEVIPNEPLVRELYGLTLYRLGKWRLAAEQLEEFARLTSSTEQHPVLADCYRALRQHRRVEELWDEIAEASLEASLVAEGRIVYAGSLADQGKVAEAIAVLEGGSLGSKKLKDHHLRMRYALADLYDRAGEQQSARRYFESVASNAPDFFDVRDRLRQL